MRELLATLTGNKRINAKALGILAGTLIVFGGMVYLVHGFQVKRNAHGLFEQAELAEREGQRERAAQYLEQYVRLAPDDIDALARYSLTLSELAKTDRARVNAFLVLESVLREDGNRQDVRREVVRLATRLGRFRDGTAWLPVQLASLGRRKHGQVLCMDHYRQANEARRRAEQANEQVAF